MVNMKYITTPRLYGFLAILLIIIILFLTVWWFRSINQIKQTAQTEVQKVGQTVREKVDGAAKKIGADYQAAKAAIKAKVTK